MMEHPNQIMDTVIRYDGKKKHEHVIWSDIENIVSQVKKYRGELVLTWHIYIRNRKLILDYFKWCEKVIDYAVNN